MALALKAQSIALDKFSCNIYNFYNDVWLIKIDIY